MWSALLDGAKSVTGTYQVSSSVVNLTKTSVITDPYGGTSAVPGAIVSYTITATVVGTGTAVGVKITDPIPANTTYKTGTLTLGGAPLTDGVDVPTPDAGDVGGTTANTVTVSLGNLTSASGAKVVKFDVTIN